MLIRDLLIGGEVRPVVTATAGTPLLEAAGLLDIESAAALVVVDRGGPLGTLSERDLVSALARHGADVAYMTVGDAMYRTLVTCTLDDPVAATLDRMSSLDVRHVPVVDGGRLVTILSVREFENACRHLKAQAETDDLTGLANRRSFLRAMESELNRHRRHRSPMAVAMLDLDRFKQINDRLGHGTGDKVLQSVARILSAELRSFDCLARIGGDEFAVLFPETRLSDAVKACRRLVTACRDAAPTLPDAMLEVGLSCGVATAHPEDTVSQLVLQRADRNLYRAKQAGRGQVVAEQVSDWAFRLTA